MGFKDFLSDQKKVSKELIESQKKREKLKEHVSELKQQVHLLEKAVSKSQQRLFGMAHAYKKDGTLPDDPELAEKVKAVAKGMSKEDVEDFASTEHDGLPEEIKEGKRGGGKKGKQGPKFSKIKISGNTHEVNRPQTPPPPLTHKTPKKPSRAERKNADKKEIES